MNERKPRTLKSWCVLSDISFLPVGSIEGMANAFHIWLNKMLNRLMKNVQLYDMECNPAHALLLSVRDVASLRLVPLSCNIIICWDIHPIARHPLWGISLATSYRTRSSSMRTASQFSWGVADSIDKVAQRLRMIKYCRLKQGALCLDREWTPG